jgi:alkyl sulfatase BDS1-like metallo-beta-lactamase superfamily hydrolase
MDRIDANAAATVSTTRAVLVDVILRRKTVAEASAAGLLRIKGDAAPVEALFEMLDDFALQFEVVAPRA